MSQPSHPAARLSSSVRWPDAGLPLDSLLRALPPGTSATEPEPGRYVVLGDVSPGLLAALTAWCAAQDVLAEEVAVERRSLEDVFLELTGREVRP